MFGYWNKSQLRQCIATHRKHVKRRTLVVIGSIRQFSSGKYSKLGDLYARLGLTGGVSQVEIKKAYYRLSKEHHPDRNEGCAVSTAKFRSITEAYEILGNVTTRAQYDRETPYGRMARRVRPTKAQPSSAFSQKDDELAEKIRIFRENMRKRSKKPSEGEDESTFRRENMFDFDAWYRAHFHDDFDTKIRDERKKMYAEQYQEQMERISKGLYRIRPPRPYTERKERSDIDYLKMEMEAEEMKKEITNAVKLALILIVGLVFAAYILQKYIDGNTQPYQDQFAKPRLKDSSTTTDKAK